MRPRARRFAIYSAILGRGVGKLHGQDAVPLGACEFLWRLGRDFVEIVKGILKRHLSDTVKACL